MTIVPAGLDVAKSGFQVHGVDENGAVTFKKQIKRAQICAFFDQLPAAVVEMEACREIDYWSLILASRRYDRYEAVTNETGNNVSLAGEVLEGR